MRVLVVEAGSFVDCKFCRSWSICALAVSIVLFGSDFNNFVVKPGHELNCPFFIAVINVDNFGAKHAACKYLAKSFFVCCFRIMTFKDCVEVG